jgi:hypothetical protein
VICCDVAKADRVAEVMPGISSCSCRSRRVCLGPVVVASEGSCRVADAAEVIASHCRGPRGPERASSGACARAPSAARVEKQASSPGGQGAHSCWRGALGRLKLALGQTSKRKGAFDLAGRGPGGAPSSANADEVDDMVLSAPAIVVSRGSCRLFAWSRVRRLSRIGGRGLSRASTRIGATRRGIAAMVLDAP